MLGRLAAWQVPAKCVPQFACCQNSAHGEAARQARNPKLRFCQAGFNINLARPPAQWGRRLQDWTCFEPSSLRESCRQREVNACWLRSHYRTSGWGAQQGYQASAPSFSLGKPVKLSEIPDRLQPLHYLLDAGDWRCCGACLPCFSWMNSMGNC